MREVNDWRLRNQQRFLHGVSLSWQCYVPARVDNDHDHCEFCLAKFMQTSSSEGYATADRKHWVCRECFVDFSDRFDWLVIQAHEE